MKSLAFLVLAVLLALPAAAATIPDNNNIPADVPERFMDRYGLFVRKDERKAFKETDKQLRNLDKKIRKAKTGSERSALEAQKAPLLTQMETLITAFWAARDPDPATPLNEFKKLIDERISDIESERFFSSTEAPGLVFSSHGGFTGDMAKVYLLHGPPDALTTVQGRLFVPLMLWVYGDQVRGTILYAFLFVESSFGPPYKLHSPEMYQMDPCGAINQIAANRSLNYVPNQGCPTHLQLVYQELIQSMPSGHGNGYIFAWALTNFSVDPSIRLGDAMQAPVPAAKAARTAGSAVVGEAPAVVPEQGVQTVLADCEHCTTMIPGTIEGSGPDATIKVVRHAVDWTVMGDHLHAEMILRIVVEGSGKPVFANKVVKVKAPLELLQERATSMTIPLFDAGELDQTPPGSYRISVYLKGSLRNRYNAWVITFTK